MSKAVRYTTASTKKDADILFDRLNVISQRVTGVKLFFDTPVDAKDNDKIMGYNPDNEMYVVTIQKVETTQ